MYTKELKSRLKRYRLRGVYPIDRLPHRKMCGGYIINTDEHDEPGEHWVAVFVNTRGTDYFDSYGRPPIDKRILKFLGSNVSYNSRMLQGPTSRVCGHYCVYFIKHRSKGWSAERIINSFPRQSDLFVKRHVVNMK